MTLMVKGLMMTMMKIYCGAMQDLNIPMVLCHALGIREYLNTSRVLTLIIGCHA